MIQSLGQNIDLCYVDLPIFTSTCFTFSIQHFWEIHHPLTDCGMGVCVRPLAHYIMQYAMYSAAEHHDTVSIHPNYTVPEQATTSTGSPQSSTALSVTQVDVPLSLSQVVGELETGSFVLVQYSTKKSQKMFAGQVVQVAINDNCVEVSFLKKVGLSSLKHVFPDVEDKVWVDHEQVVRVLPEPVFSFDKYNFYTFAEDVS